MGKIKKIERQTLKEFSKAKGHGPHSCSSVEKSVVSKVDGFEERVYAKKASMAVEDRTIA